MPDTDTRMTSSIMLLNIIILSDTKHLSIFLIRTSVRGMELEIYELATAATSPKNVNAFKMYPNCRYLFKSIHIFLGTLLLPIVPCTIPEQSPGDTAQAPNNSSALHRNCDPRPVIPTAQPSPAQPGDPRLLFPINCEMCEQRPVYL